MDQRVARARAEHWAFQPVKRVEPPPVADAAWSQNPVDRFIAAKLHAAKLQPSPEADPATLIRRLSFDLTGLPPTAEEVEAFVRDYSPKTYAALVDKLLASPRYGERWARHWLDIARYADTKGYAFQQERRYPFAYTYRDYVINAFNDDKPYDQFILEQIAADKLPATAENKHLAALGFITCGRQYQGMHDTLDDQIDVVTRGLLGLTASCSRCHDHKFDPIPTDDYYSLYGVFRSSMTPPELPLIGKPTPSPLVLRRWRELLDATKKKPDPVFAAWHALDALKEAEFPAAAAKQIDAWSNDKNAAAAKSVNRLIVAELKQNPPQKMLDVAKTYGTVFGHVHDEWKKQLDPKQRKVGEPEPQQLADAAAEEVRQVLFREHSPTVLNEDDLRQVLDRKTRNDYEGPRRCERVIQSARVSPWRCFASRAGSAAAVPADPRRRRAETVHRRQRSARPSPSDREPRQPADGAGDGQSNLAAPFWARTRRHAERFWGSDAAAVASRVARLPRERIHERGVVDQADSPPHRHVADLPAVVRCRRSGAGRPGRRSREPSVVADESSSFGIGADARRDARRRRSVGPDVARPPRRVVEATVSDAAHRLRLH